MMGAIVCDSLEKLLHNRELNYSESLKWFLMFLREYNKINKQEFALMVFYMNKDPETWKENIDSIINQYRDDGLQLEIKVRVRNDQKIRERTGELTRIEDISYFTAYSFYSGLINQAGLTKKVKDYYYIADGKREKIEYLLEG